MAGRILAASCMWTRAPLSSGAPVHRIHARTAADANTDGVGVGRGQACDAAPFSFKSSHVQGRWGEADSHLCQGCNLSSCHLGGNLVWFPELAGEFQGQRYKWYSHTLPSCSSLQLGYSISFQLLLSPALVTMCHQSCHAVEFDLLHWALLGQATCAHDGGLCNSV